ncbi:MAG: hypothetical protein UV82_C0013G0003 [Candidatus Magasanikbacteria bacterium GW2011_GWD2_43_18]|nr:MAG: hypothetical protein UV82_C0013G0003 [Candidatus Magasanikbacteria bacterium GW2011_GWD2_43_18]KKT25599.1 MAG: hypothetical protein UW10_C0006G0065 [Candidatus Magasanikbacteria bacterium GW2011_GWA2_43_9]
MKDTRFKIYVAVYLILEKNEKLLLLRRFNTHYMNGFYTPIAGHLDGNESATDAVIREAMEEAGIVITRDDVNVEHIMHRSNPEREYIDIFFVASHWQGNPTNMEPDKADDMQWFDEQHLPEKTLPEVVSVLKAIAHGVHYSEYGWE